MTRPGEAATIALLLLCAASAPASGQTQLLVGLGSTIPVGTLTDSGPFSGANAGWQGTIGLRRTVGSSGLALGARAFYGANGYEGPGGQDSSLRGFTALGTWAVTSGAVSPQLWSELGFLSHKYSSDSGGLLGGSVESKEDAFVVAGGVGASVSVGSGDLLLLGGYSHALGVFDEMQYFILTAMISLGFG